MNSNITIVIALVAATITAAFIVLLIKKKFLEIKNDEEEWPFYAKEPLLERAEQDLYHQLIQALPEYIILAQVQLSQIIKVKNGYNFGKWYNKINQMSIDFVICGRDFSIVAAIELDGKSHEKEKQKERDKKKNRALKSANIHLIRWKNYEIPNHESIRLLIKEKKEIIDMDIKRTDRRRKALWEFPFLLTY